jgi:hypothetical protein
MAVKQKRKAMKTERVEKMKRWVLFSISLLSTWLFLRP